ncbi:MAG: hypothetical protein ACKO01_11930 [Erythrobacter sp.]
MEGMILPFRRTAGFAGRSRGRELWMFQRPGTQGANRFGPDPRNPYGEDLFA